MPGADSSGAHFRCEEIAKPLLDKDQTLADSGLKLGL